MSFDDWVVRNIGEAARKVFFGDYMKDKVDEALDDLYPPVNYWGDMDLDALRLAVEKLTLADADDTGEQPGCGDS